MRNVKLSMSRDFRINQATVAAQLERVASINNTRNAKIHSDGCNDITQDLDNLKTESDLNDHPHRDGVYSIDSNKSTNDQVS